MGPPHHWQFPPADWTSAGGAGSDGGAVCAGGAAYTGGAAVGGWGGALTGARLTGDPQPGQKF